MIYKLVISMLLVFTANVHPAICKPCLGFERVSVRFYISKTIKLKKITFQSCAKYGTGNYIILVDKKVILADLKQQIPDSTYSNIFNNGIDTLNLNKIEDQNNRIILEVIIKHIENKEAIIINTESQVRVYKIKRRKYNRETGSMHRRGGIEYIDAKTKSEIMDFVLWIS